jgi:hypothetical protein
MGLYMDPDRSIGSGSGPEPDGIHKTGAEWGGPSPALSVKYECNVMSDRVYHRNAK